MAARSAASKSKSVRSTSHKIVLIIRYLQKQSKLLFFRVRGDDTIDTRLKMFTHQRDVLLAQMEEMRHTLETVEYKCWYYETAKAAGTIDVPRDMADEDVPERFRAIRRELKTIPQE